MFGYYRGFESNFAIIKIIYRNVCLVDCYFFVVVVIIKLRVFNILIQIEGN